MAYFPPRRGDFITYGPQHAAPFLSLFLCTWPWEGGQKAFPACTEQPWSQPETGLEMLGSPSPAAKTAQRPCKRHTFPHTQVPEPRNPLESSQLPPPRSLPHQPSLPVSALQNPQPLQCCAAEGADSRESAPKCHRPARNASKKRGSSLQTKPCSRPPNQLGLSWPLWCGLWLGMVP